MNSLDIVKYLKERNDYFHNQFGIHFIGLFGSYSRDEATDESDVDILYKLDENTKLSLFTYLKISSMLEDFFHKKVDLVRIDTLKPKVREYIEKDLIHV